MALSQYHEMARGVGGVGNGQETGSSLSRSHAGQERQKVEEMYITPVSSGRSAQLSGPSGLGRDDVARAGENDIMSSVVRGRAVDGLLSLGRSIVAVEN